MTAPKETTQPCEDDGTKETTQPCLYNLHRHLFGCAPLRIGVHLAELFRGVLHPAQKVANWEPSARLLFHY